MDLLSLIVHVTAAVLLIGPQVLMFLAVVPSTWLIEDEHLRRRVTRVVAARFGMIAGISLVALLVTGLYQFYAIVPEFIQEDITAVRFGSIFISKMTFFTLLIALIAIHSIFINRRIGALSDAVVAGEGDEAALESARRRSMGFSLVILLVSLTVLFLGVALGHHEFSYSNA